MEKEFKNKDISRKKGKEEIDKILAYGSVGLGLNQVKENTVTESRLEEDVKK